MARGDILGYGRLKSAEIEYIKPDGTVFFENENIKVYLTNTNNWHYKLEFRDRKEWFKFVRTINKLNKDFKKMPNIEQEE